MSCLAVERLAAAASGEDADAVAHAATCARCGALLAEQDEIVVAARALPAPVLAHRDELAAELAARLDWRTAAAFDEEPRRRWGFAIAGALAIAAAVIVVLFATRTTEAPIAVAPVAAPPTPASVDPLPAPPPIEAPPPPPPPKPVVVHKPAPPKRVVVEVPSPPAPLAPAPPAASESMLAFRAGWAALRNGRNAEAITAFDRATDPAVVEDATFWAAIAADRAGEHTNAKRRLHDFLEQYPQSPHADAARAALATAPRSPSSR